MGAWEEQRLGRVLGRGEGVEANGVSDAGSSAQAGGWSHQV